MVWVAIWLSAGLGFGQLHDCRLIILNFLGGIMYGGYPHPPSQWPDQLFIHPSGLGVTCVCCLNFTFVYQCNQPIIGGT